MWNSSWFSEIRNPLGHGHLRGVHIATVSPMCQVQGLLSFIPPAVGLNGHDIRQRFRYYSVVMETRAGFTGHLRYPVDVLDNPRIVRLDSCASQHPGSG